MMGNNPPQTNTPPPPPRVDPYARLFTQIESPIQSGVADIPTIATGDGSALKSKHDAPAGFSMRGIQNQATSAKGRIPGQGGNFKAELVAQTMIIRAARNGITSVGITDNTSVQDEFKNQRTNNKRQQIRQEDRTTRNMFHGAIDFPKSLGNFHDDILWIKAHMTTRIGPINSTHDKCDDEARDACQEEWSPMPIFCIHEEAFVLLNNEGHLIEGDPRRAAGKRANVVVFEKKLAANTLKYKGKPSNIYQYVIQNGGPTQSNSLAEKSLLL